MSFLRGLLIGTALMFIFDPVSGRRRRTLAKDKLTKYKNKTLDYGDKKSRHITNRAKGIMSETSHTLDSQKSG